MAGLVKVGAGDTAMEAWSSRGGGQDHAAYGILCQFSRHGNGLSGSETGS